jgi:glutathione synthase/RimK-type ligase-like ATP-grasp enzyme
MNTSQSSLPRILILSSAEEPSTRALNDNFIKLLNQRLGDKCVIEWRNYHDIGIELAEGQISAFLLADRTPLSDFALVYFKSYFRYQEQAAAIVEYLNEFKVPFIGKELNSYIPATKLTQLARLARVSIAIPKTLFMPTKQYAAQYELLTQELGSPFIFKAIDGATGEDNFLVKDAAQLDKILSTSMKAHFIAQSFIPNDSDLRILVLEGKVRLAIERRRKDESTHLNNTSQGASATLLEKEALEEQVYDLAIKAAAVMGRDIAGVDVMLEKNTKKPYILEVNASPQIASGAFESEKLDVYADYFKEKITP